MNEWLIRFLEGAALQSIEISTIGVECDARFGWNDSNHPSHKVIETCDDFLTASGFWYEMQLEDQ